jgi:hypothetical protein
MPEPERAAQVPESCRTCGKPAPEGCRHCLPCLQHFVRQFDSYESVHVAGLGGDRPTLVGKN